MISIETRQNRSGGWWCNCTYAGHDYSVEGESVRQARARILRRLKVQRKDVRFEKKRLYVQADPMPSPPVTYAKSRIDNLG